MELTKSLTLFFKTRSYTRAKLTILRYYYKVFIPKNKERKRGQRQVIMALMLWAIDVPHLPKQRDAKT